MKDFLSQLEDIKTKRIKPYSLLTLDLSTARSEYEITGAGNYFLVFDATDISTNVQVRFNETSADQVTLKKRQGLEVPFYRVFLTNTAQAGKTVTIAYGISDTPLKFIDQSSLVDINSIANPVDVSDRAARQLGIINSAANPIPVIRLGSLVGRGSAGYLAAPGANTVVADTGALGAGTYWMRFLLICGTALGTEYFRVQHRDSANTGTLFEYPMGIAPGGSLTFYDAEVSIAANERVRIFLLLAGAANVHGAIVYQKI